MPQINEKKSFLYSDTGEYRFYIDALPENTVAALCFIKFKKTIKTAFSSKIEKKQNEIVFDLSNIIDKDNGYDIDLYIILRNTNGNESCQEIGGTHIYYGKAVICKTQNIQGNTIIYSFKCSDPKIKIENIGIKYCYSSYYGQQLKMLETNTLELEFENDAFLDLEINSTYKDVFEFK